MSLIRIASVGGFSIVAFFMKMLIATIVFSMIAFWGHAQGQFDVSASAIWTAVPVDGVFANQSFENQAAEFSTWIMAPPIPILTPSGLSSGIGLLSQSSLTEMQAVPEPHIFGLVALGILAGVSARNYRKLTALL